MTPKILAIVATALFAVHGGYAQADEIEYPNRIELFLGDTYEGGEEGDTHGFSVGLTYERRLTKLIGVGVFGEYAHDPYNEWVFGAPLFLHPYMGFRLQIAPGVDLSRAEGASTAFLLRAGIGYEFEFGRWTIMPEINGDFVDGSRLGVFGVSFGYGF